MDKIAEHRFRDDMPVLSVPAGRENVGRLRKSIAAYLAVRDDIPTSLQNADRVAARRTRLLEKLGATDANWDDPQWQFDNRVTEPDALIDLIGPGFAAASVLREVGARFRVAISPYYLSLIDPERADCPIARQAVPNLRELDATGLLDPMDEAGSSVSNIVTRRYPDRLIIKVTNACGTYCRFCQRRRRIGEFDSDSTPRQLRQAVHYVRDNPEIRDVLLTGGDALMLSDAALDAILKDLTAIPHVEIIRLGSRAPVTLPQRVTPALVDMLAKYHPIFLNTHFNHPAEISRESAAACERLANAGIPLGNQMVLLNGINNHPFVVHKLNQELLRIRVKPYYIFHPKAVKGTSHFWLPLREGVAIMEHLRGRTSGMAIPTYIVNGPRGLGKTPLMPNYMLSMGRNEVLMRSWLGELFVLDNVPEA